MFGGCTSAGQAQSTIARFDAVAKKWSKIGDLTHARQGHNAVVTRDNTILTLGSWYADLPAEKCSAAEIGGMIKCTAQSTVFTGVAQFPEMFHVDATFCLV